MFKSACRIGVSVLAVCLIAAWVIFAPQIAEWRTSGKSDRETIFHGAKAPLNL